MPVSGSVLRGNRGRKLAVIYVILCMGMMAQIFFVGEGGIFGNEKYQITVSKKSAPRNDTTTRVVADKAPESAATPLVSQNTAAKEAAPANMSEWQALPIFDVGCPTGFGIDTRAARGAAVKRFAGSAVPDATLRLLGSGIQAEHTECSAYGARAGSWRSLEGQRCVWGGMKSEALGNVMFPGAQDRLKKEFPSLVGDSATECLIHKSTASSYGAFTSTEWLKELLVGSKDGSKKGETIVFYGHSHARQMADTFVKMATRAVPSLEHQFQKCWNFTNLRTPGNLPFDVDSCKPAFRLVEPATGRVVAAYLWAPVPTFSDLELVERLVAPSAGTPAATRPVRINHIVIARGVWDALTLGTHPEDFRVQLQFMFAEIRRRWPTTRITDFAPHIIHDWVDVKEGKPHGNNKWAQVSITFQLAYINAVYAAVHNFNEGMLPREDFYQAREGGDTVTREAFRDPVQIFDPFEMTATPEARTLGDAFLYHGHHYGEPVRVNEVIRLLRGDNRAAKSPVEPAPSVEPTEAEKKELGSRAASRLPWHGERNQTAGYEVNATIMALYDNALMSPSFHRLRNTAVQVRHAFAFQGAMENSMWECSPFRKQVAISKDSLLTVKRRQYSAHHPLSVVAASGRVDIMRGLEIDVLDPIFIRGEEVRQREMWAEENITDSQFRGMVNGFRQQRIAPGGNVLFNQKE